MNHVFFAAFVIIFLTSSTLADSIDDAEAKRRGVTVQQVQVEKLQVQMKELQSNAERLRDAIAKMNETIKQQAEEIQKLKAETAGRTVNTSSPKTQPVSQNESIAKAIKEHKLIVGMTLEQVNQSMGSPGRVTGASGDTEFYEWHHAFPMLGDREGEERYTGTIRNGVLDSYDHM